MRKLNLLAAASLLALGACTADQLAKTQTVIDNTQATVAVVLTDAQKAACAAQAGANLTVAAATAVGDTDTANGATKASALLGKGCTWTAPAA